MLKKEIVYENFDGEVVTETLYFNLSTTELLEMETSYDGGLQRMLERIIETQDIRAIVAEFKKILLAAYGVRSDNGKRFIKSDQIREEFQQTAGFDALFMELAEDPVGAAKFVAAILPKKLQEEAEKRNLDGIPKGVPAATTAPPVTRDTPPVD